MAGGRTVVVATVLVLVALVLLTLWARTRRRPTPAMPFLAHVEELRNRILTVAAVFMVALILPLATRFQWLGAWPVLVPSFYDTLAAQLFTAMTHHLVPPGVELVVMGPMDGFTAQFAMAMAFATVLTLPVALIQLFRFLAPGLYPKERRLLGQAVLPALLLFVAGAAFAYAWLLPFTLSALYEFSTAIEAKAFLSTGDLASFTLSFLIGVGIAFQAPLIMMVLTRVGLVRPATYVRRWRHAVILILIVAMVVTPDPTIVSQLMLALPLIALYGLGILLSLKVAAPET